MLTGVANCSLAPEDAIFPRFTEKTFTKSHKTSNVFSLKGFPLYGIIALKYILYFTLPGVAVLI